jgi:hypothetical protein
MKIKYFLLFGICFLLHSSCQKNKNEVSSIVYNDIVPDKYLTSLVKGDRGNNIEITDSISSDTIFIKPTELGSSLFLYFGFRIDSLATDPVQYKNFNDSLKFNGVTNDSCFVYYYIDINKDKIWDFKISISHTTERSGVVPYGYDIEIIGQKEAKVAVSHDSTWTIKKIRKDESIDSNLDFSSGATIACYNNLHIVNPNGDIYLGIRLGEPNSIKQYYGWIAINANFLQITVKDYAYSILENKSINAGQTK